MDTHGNKGFREGHQEPITFQEAENRFADLKQQYDSGSLSAEKFKAQLEEIMVRDSERRWWALHPHTGEWYSFENNEWVKEAYRRPVTFQEAENRFADLKRKFDAGSISYQEFEASLFDIMVQDSEYRWWSLQPATGEWHRFENDDWVPGTPGGKSAKVSSTVLWTGGIVAMLIVLVLVGYPFGITLWNWLQLLIVPIVIAGGGIWFNRQQRKSELKIENQRVQDSALEAYLDRMRQLLLDNNLRHADEDDEVRSLARAETKNLLLKTSNPTNKRYILEFLFDTKLIEKEHPIISLAWVELAGAELWGVELPRTNLSLVNLSEANLQRANLAETDLSRSDLRRANLIGANLTDTNLDGANLTDATVLPEQLATVKSWRGTIMPNGLLNEPY